MFCPLVLCRNALEDAREYSDGEIPAIVFKHRDLYHVIAINSGHILVYKDGTRIYTHHGLIHRDDGPAIISPTYQIWASHGLIHRDDGPAMISTNGTLVWCTKGAINNGNRPAIITDRTIEFRTAEHHTLMIDLKLEDQKIKYRLLH
jgi:hypothetical protein